MTEAHDEYLTVLRRLDRLPAQVAQDERQREEQLGREAEGARLEERRAKDEAKRLRTEAQEAVDAARQVAARVGLDGRLPRRLVPRDEPSDVGPEALREAVKDLEKLVDEFENAQRAAEEQERRERERRQREQDAAARATRRRRRILLGVGAAAVVLLALVLGLQFAISADAGTLLAQTAWSGAGIAGVGVSQPMPTNRVTSPASE